MAPRLRSAAPSIIGGTLTSSGGGEIDVSSFVEFDGKTDGALTTSANVVVSDLSLLLLLGTIINSGTIGLNSTGDPTGLGIAGAVTLQGRGHVTLSDNVNNQIEAASTGASLTNVDNTISGAGQIGQNDGNLTLINQGTIDANSAANPLTIHTGNTVTNSGLLEATLGGTLAIDDSVANSIGALGGTILASGAGSQVILDPLTITGGTVKTLGGGTIETAANSGQSTITGAAISNAGTLEANSGSTLDIQASFNNAGVLDANGGDLIVTGNVSGAGSATISQVGEIEFGEKSTQSVTFAAGANGILKLDKAKGYTGTISGFSGPSGGGLPPVDTPAGTVGTPITLAGGDSIDLADFSFFGTGTVPSLAYAPNSGNTGGTLTVTDGTLVAHIALLGQYIAAGFHDAPDSGTGTATGPGTMITYEPPTLSPPPPS